MLILKDSFWMHQLITQVAIKYTKVGIVIPTNPMGLHLRFKDCHHFWTVGKNQAILPEMVNTHLDLRLGNDTPNTFMMVIS